MAGGAEAGEGAEFKGLSKYFNSTTFKGRANTAKATYAFIALTVVFFKLKPKKQ